MKSESERRNFCQNREESLEDTFSLTDNSAADLNYKRFGNFGYKILESLKSE